MRSAQNKGKSHRLKKALWQARKAATGNLYISHGKPHQRRSGRKIARVLRVPHGWCLIDRTRTPYPSRRALLQVAAQDGFTHVQ